MCVRVRVCRRVPPPLLVQTLGAPTIAIAGGDSNQNGAERPIAGVTASDRVVDEAPDCQAEEKKSRLEGVRSKVGGRSRKGNGSESGTRCVVWVVVLGGSKAHAFDDQRD